jgi:hypothetical protein
MALANAAGVVTAGVYVVCRVLVGTFPGMMFGVTQSWFHGMELRRFDAAGLSAGAFITGLVTSVLVAWLVGYLFAVAYNYFDKK